MLILQLIRSIYLFPSEMKASYSRNVYIKSNSTDERDWGKCSSRLHSTASESGLNFAIKIDGGKPAIKKEILVVFSVHTSSSDDVVLWFGDFLGEHWNSKCGLSLPIYPICLDLGDWI